jgi:uncharacterized damage-inducible protein DinB
MALVPSWDILIAIAGRKLMEAPLSPVGEFVKDENYTPTRLNEFIDQIESAPAALRNAVTGLTHEQLETKYRNWTIRQIVHHLADSHVNSYIRFKWALTEELPTIKAYFEDRWVALDDSRTGAIDKPLALFDAIHARWAQLLKSMQLVDFDRSFIHPETGQTVNLKSALSYYPWHSRHHTGQIVWLRERHGW